MREKPGAAGASQEPAGEIWADTPGDQPKAADPERGSRRTGIVLIVIGCVLMALAAAETYATTISAALGP